MLPGYQTDCKCLSHRAKFLLIPVIIYSCGEIFIWYIYEGLATNVKYWIMVRYVSDKNTLADLEMKIYKAEHFVIHRTYSMLWDPKATHEAAASMQLKIIIHDPHVGDLAPKGNLWPESTNWLLRCRVSWMGAIIGKKVFGAASHKGNKWITNGIIKSLKFRDKICKEMQSLDPNSSSYFTTKQNSSVCNQLLKQSIREAKTMYYNNEFNKNRSNMCKMWIPYG